VSGLSVRARLTLWNIGVLTLALLVFAVVVHQVVSRLLTASIDRDLAQQAAAPSPDELNLHSKYIWLASGKQIPPPFPLPGLPGSGGAPRGPRELLATRTITRVRQKLPEERSDVVFSRSHTFVMLHLRSGPDPRADGIDGMHVWDRLVHRAAAGQTGYDSVVTDGQQWRAYFRPWSPSGKALGAVLVAYPLGERDNLLGSLDRTLIILIPLALLAAGIGGAFLSSRALRPVREIALAAAAVEANDLSRRLPAHGRDEFFRLAATFNAMFDRLQAAFKRLENSVEHQKRFSADASHELRTPLTSIQANAEWALRRDRTTQEHRET
jgi:signal transduction histidine kinase